MKEKDQRIEPVQPDYIGHRKRIKERILTKGANSLTETDLLEALLTYSIPRKDVKPLAKNLLRRFSSLRNVLSAEATELMETKGIKESSVALIKLAEGICFQMLSPSQKKTTYLDNWNLIFDFARMHLSHLDEEALLCLFLTPTKRLIKHEIFSNGTINSIDIPTHKIISRCVSLKASFLILFHNHPSGNFYPSKEDIQSNNILMEKLNPLGVRLIDHLIIGNNHIYSIINKGFVKED
ncbi:MAG: DNA repair protein RadC [Alphaproteobacteria bacterium]|nr:DNA repair protein RadC [Alphaproteobacteria bacterium]